ncbi:MAG: sugar kinase [bacterium]
MTKKKKVVTIGESLLRITPKDDRLALEQADEFTIDVAGTESNVAIGLSRLGVNAIWISKLVASPLGRKIANKIAMHRVDVSHVIWTESGRVGTYYLEFGPKPRGVNIIYDRKDSAFSHLKHDEIDWSVLDGADLLHLTGITPALSETARHLIEVAMEEGKSRGIPISFDINYRAKLWDYRRAREALEPLMKGVKVAISTEDDIKNIFEMKGEHRSLCESAMEKFGCEVVAITLGDKGSVVYDGREFIEGTPYDVDVVDRVGAGDAFDAGLLYGYLHGNLKLGVKYGSALAALCHTYKGDIAWVTRRDVQVLCDRSGENVRR